MTPEDYRRRYFELKRAAQETAAKRPVGRLPQNPKLIPSDLIIADEIIPPGWYWTARIARGQTLRLINDEASPGLSALFWNAHDPSERYNAGDTVKVQWTARLTAGRLLLSDMGRVLASITADSCGFHDSILGGSTRASDAHNYGADAPKNPEHRNSRDNFVLAAGKLGLGPRDVGPCITFFAPVVTDEAGAFRWNADVLEPQAFVDLRAEMDLLMALSNCPHPLSPAQTWAPKPVRALIWRSPAPTSDDLCRTGTTEAIRAFENTDALAGGAA
jgi:urea carboxylase-associated protein 2